MTDSTLKKKRNHLMEQLRTLDPDMLRGSLVKTYRRCGKPTCHCTREKGHEGHSLSVSMPGRSPIMVYVSLKNQERVRQALENYQTAQRIIEDISTVNREALVKKEIL
ncbi:MAG: hypothetical protein JNJ47_00370 [Alphaproteobacteria bacterium]|jgi:hypothetical protein|nr:hypothetical protein [Alphaproteobacteria bacterium]